VITHRPENTKEHFSHNIDDGVIVPDHQENSQDFFLTSRPSTTFQVNENWSINAHYPSTYFQIW